MYPVAKQMSLQNLTSIHLVVVEMLFWTNVMDRPTTKHTELQNFIIRYTNLQLAWLKKQELTLF